MCFVTVAISPVAIRTIEEIETAKTPFSVMDVYGGEGMGLW